MQLLIVDGRLGKDAEVKMSQNGDKYLKFSLANRVFRNGEEDTVWYDVVTSDPKFLNKLPEHLKKGSYVIVSGHLSVTVRTADSKIYTNLTVRPSSIEFGGGGKKSEDDNASTVSTPTTPAPVVNPVENTAPESTFVAPQPVAAAPSSLLGAADEDDLPF